MECLQNLVCGETFFIAMEQRNHVLMCERFVVFKFQTWDFFLVIDMFTDMLE